MEIYSNEHEQVDALKHFFARNGKVLAVGVILGIGALVGWRYWSQHQDSASRETSMAYQQVASSLDASKPASLDAAEKFVGDNQNTYGALTSLELAKRYVDNQQFDKAIAQLQSGLQKTKDANIQAVLNLRLARIQLQQKQADDALKTLDNIQATGWEAVVAELRGEALLSKGDTNGARDAWNKGATSDTASPALKDMLHVKMNNLPG